MITGETEAILSSQLYDDFLFGSKASRLARKTNRKSNRTIRRSNRKTNRQANRVVRKENRLERRLVKQTSPLKQLKRQRRSAFIQDIGQLYKSTGASKAISKGINSIIPDYSAAETPSDYKMSIGAAETTSIKKSSIPKIALIAGGVLVVGLLGVVVMKKSKPAY